MGSCEKCGAAIPEGAAFCPTCGTAKEPPPDATVELPTPPPGADSAFETVPAPPPSSRIRVTGRPGTDPPSAPNSPSTPISPSTPTTGGTPGSRPPSGAARYAPGTILGDRYRIVGLLGSGGMGEVYRADDLRLGESVALKFLPPHLASDIAALDRLRDEVRLTRQITHPNICRVHDLVELEGETCICMEYIDGEDLAGLLRRIGRLSEDKGIDIARQLCAGLAAAHERGVLHRDLKPANVMLDGRGRVKINDFGVAAIVELTGSADGFAGTPIYMAPEVLRGEPATVRSDIYSLGLAIFEVFTGRRAIEGDSISSIRRWHEESSSGDLMNQSGLEPIVIDVIQRCLEPDPRDRPASALAVAALFPGGDPLLQALAAGETPSPQEVAAAGGSGTISRQKGGLLFFTVVVGLALVALLDRETRLTEIAPMGLAPDVLEFRAQELITQFGYEDTPMDSARGFHRNGTLIRFIERADKSSDRWLRLRDPDAGAIQFWYRQSPDRLVPQRSRSGLVRANDPPRDHAGMVYVNLTATGDLLHFSAVSDRNVPETPVAAETDWTSILTACGYDIGVLEEEPPQLYAPVLFDAMRAWVGPHPGIDRVTSHIEIASWQGRPVHVRVRQEWGVEKKREGGVPGRDFFESIDEPSQLILFLVPLFAGAWFGIANLRAGRGDRAGAFKVGFGFVILLSAVWLIRAHHVGSLDDERRLLVRMLSDACFMAVFAWFLYLAIEPTVRRHWPQKLVSWSRLLQGGWGDALVGRDLLVGIACGVGMSCLERVHWVVAADIATAPPAPLGMNFSILESPRQALGQILYLLGDSAFSAIVAMFILVLFLLLTRRRWAAYALIYLVGLVRLPYSTFSELIAFDLAFRALAVALILIAIHRSLLSTLGAIFVVGVLGEAVITLDSQAWYLPQGILAVLVIGGFSAAVSFRACRECEDGGSGDGGASAAHRGAARSSM